METQKRRLKIQYPVQENLINSVNIIKSPNVDGEIVDVNFSINPDIAYIIIDKTSVMVLKSWLTEVEEDSPFKRWCDNNPIDLSGKFNLATTVDHVNKVIYDRIHEERKKIWNAAMDKVKDVLCLHDGNENIIEELKEQ